MPIEPSGTATAKTERQPRVPEASRNNRVAELLIAVVAAVLGGVGLLAIQKLADAPQAPVASIDGATMTGPVFLGNKGGIGTSFGTRLIAGQNCQDVASIEPGSMARDDSPGSSYLYYGNIETLSLPGTAARVPGNVNVSSFGIGLEARLRNPNTSPVGVLFETARVGTVTYSAFPEGSVCLMVIDLMSSCDCGAGSPDELEFYADVKDVAGSVATSTLEGPGGAMYAADPGDTVLVNGHLAFRASGHYEINLAIDSKVAGASTTASSGPIGLDVIDLDSLGTVSVRYFNALPSATPAP